MCCGGVVMFCMMLGEDVPECIANDGDCMNWDVCHQVIEVK